MKEVRVEGGTVYALAAEEMTAETVWVHASDCRHPVATLSPASVTAFAVDDGRFLVQGGDGRLRVSNGDGWTSLGPALARARCIDPV